MHKRTVSEQTLLKRISIHPQVCGGRPCVKGHRIPVELILDFVASGVPPQEICSNKFYPSLTLEDVLACIAFANQFVKFVKSERIHVSEETTASKR